jgi:hypothetical protein
MIRPVFIGILLLMSACVPAGSANLAQNTSARPTITGTEQERSTLPAPTLSKVINSTPILEPVTTLAETALEPTVSPALEICSPLEDISLAELPQPDLLKNPFQPPRPGMDDGHHGVDFAYWSRGERKTMLGLPVLSVLAGQVAGIILNRQPYGYAIIIETPLDGFPAAGPVNVNLPTPARRSNRQAAYSAQPDHRYPRVVPIAHSISYMPT